MRAALKIALSATLGLSLFATTTMVNAQDTQSSAPQAMQSTQKAPEISDSQLKQFAQASKKVSQISTKAISKLQGTKDKNKQATIRKEANGEMVQAVQKSGLSVQDYNQISQLVRSNPDLQQKIQKLLNS